MSHTNLTVYGATWCGDCKRAKKFLGEQLSTTNGSMSSRILTAWRWSSASTTASASSPRSSFMTTIAISSTQQCRTAAKLGLQTAASMNYYDLICIGGGPASLTAALYAAREGLDVLDREKRLGGQAGVTDASTTSPASLMGSAGVSLPIG